MPTNPTPGHSGLNAALRLATLYLTVGLGLRLVLVAALMERAPFAQTAAAFALGLLDDLLVAPIVTCPVVLVWILLRRDTRPARWLRAGAVGVFAGLTVFGSFVEYFYFEEFDARFNNIAVDYVLFPGEVVGNVFESYNVPLYAGLAVAAGAAAAWLARTWPAAALAPRPTWRRRLGCTSTSVLVALASIGLLAAVPRGRFENRELNELAGNGLVHLVRAYLSADLDYELYYRTLPSDVARARAQELLQVSIDPSGSLVKHLEPSVRWRPPSQVVVVLEESLGSDFVGSTGHAKTPSTPELDRWMPQGLALSNLIANGNRTVRGLEGVLCSFVPLPGDSIVKRDKSDDVATLARVFQSAGYSTAFYYGGYGVFDFMKPFMLANGYEQFIEQSDYPSDAFSTIWGVADEFIFDALLERQRTERAAGRPLFATLLSVSNHKPYRVPPDRPGFTGDKRPGRHDAVRYADWCIGRYLDTLRAEGFLDDTLVLVVGDHGARVYGSEAIPMRSYRIPALFVGGPDLAGRKLERLCSQIDLAPTLLDLCGIEAKASFLGQSLLGLPPDGGRAWVHHNRDIGLVTDDALVVLGLRQDVTFYTRPGRDSLDFVQIPREQVEAPLQRIADDATAVFQTAYEVYQARGLGSASAAPRQ